MRILIANPYFPPWAPGGAEHSLERLCHFLSTKGIAVSVFTNCYDGNPRVESPDGYAVRYLDSPITLEPGQHLDAASYVGSEAYRSYVLQSIISESETNGRPDALIANNAPCFVVIAQAGKRLCIPSIGIVRDTQVICETGACVDCKTPNEATPCRGLTGSALCNLKFQRQRGCRNMRSLPGILYDGFYKGIHRRDLRRRGLKELDHIVTISEGLKTLVGKIPGIKAENISVLGNIATKEEVCETFELESFLSKNGLKRNSYFLVAGKKSYGKGSDIAVASMRTLHAKHPTIRLLFVGKGNVNALDHESWVDCQSVPQKLLMALIANCIALIIPGRWQEGLHRTMVDAVRMGIPVICSDSGGPQEGVENGETGYVVTSGDADALCSTMEKIINWKEDQHVRCKDASKIIFDNKWKTERIVEEWIKLLDSCGKPHLEIL